jgi:hypothetical protein
VGEPVDASVHAMGEPMVTDVGVQEKAEVGADGPVVLVVDEYNEVIGSVSTALRTKSQLVEVEVPVFFDCIVMLSNPLGTLVVVVAFKTPFS